MGPVGIVAEEVRANVRWEIDDDNGGAAAIVASAAPAGFLLALAGLALSGLQKKTRRRQGSYVRLERRNGLLLVEEEDGDHETDATVADPGLGPEVPCDHDLGANGDDEACVVAALRFAEVHAVLET